MAGRTAVVRSHKPVVDTLAIAAERIEAAAKLIVHVSADRIEALAAERIHTLIADVGVVDLAGVRAWIANHDGTVLSLRMTYKTTGIPVAFRAKVHSIPTEVQHIASGGEAWCAACFLGCACNLNHRPSLVWERVAPSARDVNQALFAGGVKLTVTTEKRRGWRYSVGSSCSFMSRKFTPVPGSLDQV